ncbi:hypothetical protein K0B04_01825 [Patescibacteria group bacterium]|nr:hypothetical protein [Patescibacteria group bacterium]
MKNTIKIITITAFVILFSAGFNKALAEPLLDKSDTMSRLGNSSAEDVYSDHTIQFTTPSGVASGETIVITFPSDFDGTTHPNGTLDFSDIDMFIDSSTAGTCSLNPQTLVASGPTESQWEATFSGTESRVLTLTSGGASALVSAEAQVCIKIGQNATGGTANSQYLNPSSSGSFTISITAGSLDSGDISVSIIDNDRVTITAEVTETITFSISDYAINFGNLTPANARFATTTNGANPPSVSAHTMSVYTNGSTGYEITYLGSTLTNQVADEIAVATITGDEDGAPGTEQFAIGFTTSDDANIIAAYDQADPTFNYNFVADTETPFIYENGPSETETISAFYLANISGVTPAGSYSTSLTYVATANF